MASVTGRTTTKKTSTTTGKSGSTRKADELLVVTQNELGMMARLTTPLSKNNINIECFTAYEWGHEAAFRIVTDNNRKARDILRSEGFNVQENPVALWYTTNEPGRITKAAMALANAHINTFCSYSTGVPNSDATVIAFDTSDTKKTIEVLNNIR
ncbi:MAG: hypothetical protein WC956_02545 [bacterium]